jgi:hypothetical protein
MEKVLRWKARPLAWLALLLVLALVAAAVGFARTSTRSPAPDRPGIGLATGDEETPVPRMPATQFRVSTFNLLGAGHTKPGGDKPGYASGYTRMGWSVELLRDYRIDIVGFQEMRPIQFSRFMELSGKTWGIYPGNQLADAAMANSIAWRKDTWNLLQASTIQIPYFEGSLIRMPYLLMENRETGQRFWFANFHNPANPKKYGDQEKWRDKATALEIGLVNRLHEADPSIPFVMTGDFNEREEFFCKMVSKTPLRAANGGGITPEGTCVPPKKMPVDWILGTDPEVGFTGYRALRTPLVEKTTDHPLVFSDASVAPLTARRAPTTRVIAISVEGLRSLALTKLPPEEIRALTKLMTQGVSTLNARTVEERTTSLPNDVSMFSGRRVTASLDGHGIFSEADTGETVHQRAGHYVSSAFDIVHNFGRSTALYANRENLDLADRTWDATNGGTDPHGLDDGRDKIGTYVADTDADALVEAMVTKLADRPSALTFLQLALPDRAGHADGFLSPEYLDAVKHTSRLVGRVLRTVNDSPKLAGRTVVVLTSEHGGVRTSHSDPTLLENYRVPFAVWGAGVAEGANLYDLNPHLTPPGTSRAGYDSPPPVRNAFLANLVTMLLRMPAVPGSRFNQQQDLNVFPVPSTPVP